QAFDDDAPYGIAAAAGCIGNEIAHDLAGVALSAGCEGKYKAGHGCKSNAPIEYGHCHSSSCTQIGRKARNRTEADVRQPSTRAFGPTPRTRAGQRAATRSSSGSRYTARMS